MDSAKIMIVEDNTAVAEDCRDCLEGLGYAVTSIVASGEESIEKAEAERPDAVIMDIQLRDEMDGIEAAEEIYSRLRIPVVFLSAYSDRELLQRAKRVGSFGFLVKPFKERDLYATIEMALHKAKADAAILSASRMEATSTLAGGIAHDYNNLMQVVLGNTDFVLRELGEKHPNADMLREVILAAGRASDLTQRLVAFAREGMYRRERLDLNRVVRDFHRAHAHTVPCRIRLRCEVGDRPQYIMGDRAQVEMLLTCVWTNAIEAVDGEGEIHIASRTTIVSEAETNGEVSLKPGPYGVLIVEDTGPGMSDDVLVRAFEPFFSTKFLGRGLGLAAAHGIAENHGGRIVLESKEREGTTCTIYLPVVEPEIDQPPIERMEVSGEKETVLVVDDDEGLRGLIERVLVSLGYRVLTADNGRSALDRAREHEGAIHLVLLDMGMPVMDGATAFPLLKMERPDMKVLLFSGYDLDSAAQNLLDAGASGFLMKPVRTTKLAAEIRRTLDD